MVGPRFSPRTFRSWHLGHELRRLREEAGLEGKQVGKDLHTSAARLTRIEQGVIKPSRGDVLELLVHYGVPIESEHAQALLEMAVGLKDRGWWQQFDSAISSYRTLIAFEAEADLERCVELVRIPGLLQTSRYAHAIISSGPEPMEERAIQELVEVRMKRQMVLSRPNHPIILDAIIGEAALLDAVDGRETRAEQLDHLAEATQAGNVTVRVLPLEAGLHGASLGSHTLLRYQELSIGSTETLSGQLFFERPAAVDRLTLTLDYLTERCLSPEASVDFIRQVAHRV